jgi:hypothetical protein
MQIGDLAVVKKGMPSEVQVGLIVEIEDIEEYNSLRWSAFRILLNDGKLLYFFKDELEPVTEEVNETR